VNVSANTLIIRDIHICRFVFYVSMLSSQTAHTFHIVSSSNNNTRLNVRAIAWLNKHIAKFLGTFCKKKQTKVTRTYISEISFRLAIQKGVL
jgi:hypothetical protein